MTNASDRARGNAAVVRTGSDAIIAALLFSGTVLYWASLPHSLQPADESVHLYEAKRLLEGEVLYRDFFNFITPGWFYLMASLFRLFGTSIETARATMAVVHGLTAVLVYFACRRLEIRRELSVLPAFAYLALCQSAWPLVSQHWISTILCAALLFAWTKQRESRTASLLGLAIALGLLISVQQQRGVFMAVATVVWLLADAGLRRWYAFTPTASAALRQAAILTAGTTLVVGLILTVAVATAGFAAVWNALVIFPLFNYRSEMSCPWGDVNLLSGWYAQFTYPLVLKYLPVVLVVSFLRLAWLAARRRELAVAQGLLLVLIFCGASALSIAYFPDFIKISFIAFAFCVAAAENLEWLARKTPGSPHLKQIVLWTLAAGALVLAAWHLSANQDALRRIYPISHMTAFGRVDYKSAEEAQLRDQLDALLDTAPTRALYAYPILADLYLTVPADNPTPYGFFFAAGYHSPEQVQQVIDILRARQLPYIVALPGFQKADDPVFRYITEAYEPLSAKPLAGRMIYRRIP